MLLPGTNFAEQFEIVRVIGEGANGVVYEARQLLLARSVALKILPRELLLDEKSRSRFAAESQFLSQLDHPNIVRCFSSGLTSDGQPFMVNELVTGKNLEELLQEKTFFEAEFCRTVFEQIFAALAYAHRLGIVHRDLKPSNIMISSEERVKLIDFGLAKLFNESAQLSETPQSLTQSGSFIGTPAYMSPEQAKGAGVDCRTDIYSLGVLMYECLSGRKPFVSESPMELMYMHLNQEPPDLVLPSSSALDLKALNFVIKKCLNKNPDERFSSIDELAKAFSEALGAGTMSGMSLAMKCRIAGFAGLGLALASLAAFFLWTHQETAPKKLVKNQHLLKHETIAGKVGSTYDLLMAAKRKRKVAYEESWQTSQKFCREALQAYDHALERKPDLYDQYAIYLGKANTIRTLAEHIDPGLSESQRKEQTAQLRTEQIENLHEAMDCIKADWKYERVVLLRELAICLYSIAYDQGRNGQYGQLKTLLEEAIAIKDRDPSPCPDSEGRQNAVDDDVSNSLAYMYMLLAEIDCRLGDLEGADDCYRKMWKRAPELGRFGFVDHDQFLCLIEYPKFLWKNGKQDEARQKFAVLESELEHVEPNHSIAANYIDLARAYAKLGLKKEAGTACNRALLWLRDHQEQAMLADLNEIKRLAGF